VSTTPTQLSLNGCTDLELIFRIHNVVGIRLPSIAAVVGVCSAIRTLVFVVVTAVTGVTDRYLSSVEQALATFVRFRGLVLVVVVVVVLVVLLVVSVKGAVVCSCLTADWLSEDRFPTQSHHVPFHCATTRVQHPQRTSPPPTTNLPTIHCPTAELGPLTPPRPPIRRHTHLGHSRPTQKPGHPADPELLHLTLYYQVRPLCRFLFLLDNQGRLGSFNNQHLRPASS
jgi:hypothetical protein